MTKRIALCLLALFAGGLLRGQQTLSSYIAEDPERAAGVLHVYETFDTFVTPPPAGFVPFYVTHYGRHGSRYHLSNAVFDDPLAALDQAEDEGILTEDGRMLAAVLRRLREELEFSVWEPLPDGRTAVRLVTNWATTDEDIQRVKEII